MQAGVDTAALFSRSKPVTLRPTDLQRWGLDAVEVLELIRTAYQGDVVGQGYEGNVVFNVIAILDAHARARLTQIGDLPLRTPSGALRGLSRIRILRTGGYSLSASRRYYTTSLFMFA